MRSYHVMLEMEDVELPWDAADNNQREMEDVELPSDAADSIQ